MATVLIPRKWGLARRAWLRRSGVSQQLRVRIGERHHLDRHVHPGPSWLSRALLVLASAAFVVLAALVLQLAWHRSRVVADIAAPEQVFGFFAIVAALDLLGVRLFVAAGSWSRPSWPCGRWRFGSFAYGVSPAARSHRASVSGVRS